MLGTKSQSVRDFGKKTAKTAMGVGKKVVKVAGAVAAVAAAGIKIHSIIKGDPEEKRKEEYFQSKRDADEKDKADGEKRLLNKKLNQTEGERRAELARKKVDEEKVKERKAREDAYIISRGDARKEKKVAESSAAKAKVEKDIRDDKNSAKKERERMEKETRDRIRANKAKADAKEKKQREEAQRDKKIVDKAKRIAEDSRKKKEEQLKKEADARKTKLQKAKAKGKQIKLAVKKKGAGGSIYD